MPPRPDLAACLALASLSLIAPAPLPAQDPSPATPDPLAGAWPAERRRAILEKTLELRLAPDLSHLTPGERRAVDELLAVGAIMQRLYEEALHHQAAAVRERLAGQAADAGLEDLRTLFRLFHGPIATTLDNRREPLLAVDPPVPGRNMYPWDIASEEVEAFLAAHPERREEILGERTVVRRATEANLAADQEILDRPV